MKKQKFIAAMSGGVDSTVAAALYKEMGHEIIGVTLRMKPPADDSRIKQACASPEDERMAQAAAEKLGIEHHIVESQQRFFEEVLRPAWNEYNSGRTPNPCTICNYKVKFAEMIRYAEEQGADGIITGHYAKIIAEDGKYLIQRGADRNKDQTYFLFNLRQNQLAKIRFPIGDISKDEVRNIARDFEFLNSEKKDSQDACFLYDNETFPESLRLCFNEKASPGRFISTDGRVLGEHEGIHNYTIGQRKGLRVALGRPAYIKKIDPKTRNIVLTTENEDLLRANFKVKNINWQSGEPVIKPFACFIQVRYRSQPVKGFVMPSKDGTDAAVKLDSHVRAVTPGQAAVFFDEDILLGGGVISI